MKHLNLLIILLVILNIDSVAQNVEWAVGNIGPGNEEGYGTALDNSGNLYVIGRFQATVDFDPSPDSTFNLTSNGSTDIFIQKLDSQGNFLWAKSFGGPLLDDGFDVVVNSSNEVILTGMFALSVDFDPGAGTFSLNSPTDGRIFLLKLDSAGNFVYAKAIGGSFSSGNVDINRNSLDIDNNDNLFLTGNFENTPDFDPSSSTFNLTSNGSKDVFILKFDNSGNLIWGNSFGGADRDMPIGLSLDGAGNVITAGEFKDTSVDFDPGPGVFTVSGTENFNSFVQKLDNNGNFIWALSYGDGDQVERVKVMTTDNSNSIYLAGRLRFSTDFDPGPGVFNLNAPSGFPETYVMKLDVSGMFEWAGVFSVDIEDIGAMTTDNQNNLYITGAFSGTENFDTDGSSSLTATGTTDGYISKFDENGDHQWVAQLNSSDGLTPLDVIVDNSGFTYCTGFFNENAISDGNGGWLLNGVGVLNSQAFIVKLDQPTLSTPQNEALNLIQYPNPTHGIVFFKGLDNTNKYKVRIINSTGKIVYETFSNLKNGLELPEQSGMYFIQLIDNSKATMTFKVFKK